MSSVVSSLTQTIERFRPAGTGRNPEEGALRGEGNEGRHGPRPAAANLDDQETGRDLADRHRDEGDGPGGGADVVGDAERANRGLCSVAERKREDHPGRDSNDQQRCGEPANASEGQAVGCTHMRGKTEQDTEHDSERREGEDERQVVAVARKRVDVELADEEDRGERTEQATEIELALAGLTQNEEDEESVDEVIGSGHAKMVGFLGGSRIGAGVDLQVDLSPQPAG